ncbi:thioesterase II family protein [Dictyobacter arantiisoli]|uniref:Thioesterase n=1 Tax=Dictyobacter arantiisoli TaxID=2014874 RepID=A0A5A5TC66_9CHLR|nr:thioesterase domain-containing protein [Dictyobacter arantiisoli]GCF09100.1 thioesterase [Dictyobacter arantiisoli]
MTNTPWIVSNQSHPSNRLFCFPYAGGGANSIYRTWQQILPPGVEVCPVLLPGREMKLQQPAYTDTAALVPQLAQQLLPYMNVPFQFFGHSMGALLSFELTRELRRQRLTLPTRLFVSAHRAPQLPRRSEPVHSQPDAEFIHSLRTLGGTPEAVLQNEELLQLFLPTLRADFTLCETYNYQPEEPFNLPIAVFGGQTDKDIPASDLAAWQAQSTRPITQQMFQGGHFYLHNQQAQLLQAIQPYYR